MVKTKKTKFKPLSAKNKIMIDTAKLLNRGITGEQLEKIIDEKFKKYIADDLLNLKIVSKELFFKAVILGASFGVLGSFAITSVFRAVDDPSMINNGIGLFGILCFIGCLFYANSQFEKFKETGK